ncbi:MAG: AEC family transporter [Oscillospiraceae bacterium]|nr:AEC family transporter [Oscillospiraceae bacterium]
MGIVIEQAILVLMFTVVGFTLVKTKLIDSKHTKILSTLAVYVYLSSTVFRTFATNFTISYLKEKYMLVIVSAVILVVLLLIMKPLSKLFAKDNEYKRNVLNYCMIVPNYGYVGYAMAEGIFGSLMLQNVLMVTIPVSMYAYTFGYCLLTRSKVSPKKLINPVTIAMVAGAIVGLLEIPLPSVLAQFLGKAAGCMGPTGMILIGAVTAEYPLRQMLKKKEVYFITALRLLVVPLVLGLGLRLLKLEMAMIPVMLVMAMPTSANAIVFPKLVGEDCQTGASLALISNVLCCASIPLIFWLFGLMP